MVAIADIYRFIRLELDNPNAALKPDTDIFTSFDLSADVCADLMEHFADNFKVDISDYLWYFHHGEAGLNVGGLVFSPPYNRVERIPITPAILRESAKEKCWKLTYPEHSIPKKRLDMWINKVILFLIFGYFLNRFATPLLERFL